MTLMQEQMKQEQEAEEVTEQDKLDILDLKDRANRTANRMQSQALDILYQALEDLPFSSLKYRKIFLEVIFKDSKASTAVYILLQDIEKLEKGE